jgi:flagellar motor switch protein FliG
MDVVTMSLDRKADRNVRPTNDSDAGLRKAAILVASLDPSAADAILDQLAPEQADLVRQFLIDLDEIAAEERQRVVDEFRRIGPMVPGDCPGGIELDGPMSDTKPRPSVAPEDVTNGRGVMSDASDAPPFDFLSEAEDERLAQLLRGERSPTVALVLSHLPPYRAGEVLACFTPAMQVEVVRRLADIENTDPETVREVERALESRWSRQFDADGGAAAGGPDAVARILAACDQGMRGRILANLAAHDQPLAERFGHHAIVFEDLALCDDATLLAVLRAAAPEVTQAALLGAPPTVLDRFLHCMPAEDAISLRHALDYPEPIRLSDVEEAQRQIAALAQQLSHANPDRTSFAA